MAYATLEGQISQAEGSEAALRQSADDVLASGGELVAAYTEANQQLQLLEAEAEGLEALAQQERDAEARQLEIAAEATKQALAKLDEMREMGVEGAVTRSESASGSGDTFTQQALQLDQQADAKAAEAEELSASLEGNRGRVTEAEQVLSEANSVVQAAEAGASSAEVQIAQFQAEIETYEQRVAAYQAEETAQQQIDTEQSALAETSIEKALAADQAAQEMNARVGVIDTELEAAMAEQDAAQAIVNDPQADPELVAQEQAACALLAAE